MYAKRTQLINRSGLHARPATEFVKAAKEYESRVTVRNLDQQASAPVDAKSLIRLLAAGLTQGTRIEIAADGVDEVAAVEALTRLVESGFGE